MPYDPHSRDTTSNTPSGRADDERVKAAWSDLQRDLDALGRQLNELRNHSSTLGEHLVNSVQASFDQVRGRTMQSGWVAKRRAAKPRSVRPAMQNA
jgi:hypothetical protein